MLSFSVEARSPYLYTGNDILNGSEHRLLTTNGQNVTLTDKPT